MLRAVQLFDPGVHRAHPAPELVLGVRVTREDSEHEREVLLGQVNTDRVAVQDGLDPLLERSLGRKVLAGDRDGLCTSHGCCVSSRSRGLR
jgi:hypothetical protein